MDLKLRVWRQESGSQVGRMVDYELKGVSEHSSFLEMLDQLNEELISRNEDPIAFDHDCREGICGACSLVINGTPHGPQKATTTCQLHMRQFSDGDTVYIEPWRAKAFPVIKDLVTDRGAFDRIIQSGGFVSINTGGTPDANATPIGKDQADIAMDAAECIGCGACVAACRNASAMLFVGAKVSQLSTLPQGQVERKARVLNMVDTMDGEGFGQCTNQFECEAACPKEISVKFISKLNSEYAKAAMSAEDS